MNVRLKDVVATNRKSLPETTDPDFSFRYIDISAVSQGRINVPDEDLRFVAAPSRARRVADPGDTVVSTVRTYLRAVAPVPKTPEPLVFSTGFAVLHPIADRIDSRYLSYYCTSAPFIESVVARSVGVSYPAINASEVADIRLDLPTLDEQRRIADFLDTETARLDALEHSRRAQLVLLEERRWSYLDELLRQLDPPIVPVRRALSRITDGPFGSAFTSDSYTDEGAVVVRLGNIGFDEYRSSNEARIPLALYRQFLRHRVYPGDVLIAGLGDTANHAGRACVAPDLGPAIVKGKSFAARVSDGVALPEYLSLVFSSPIGRDAFAARGSTRQMINLEVVRSAVVPLPDLETQREIARRMAERESVRRRAHDQLRVGIALLRERRQALITAAVTGQLDVTTARGASA